MQTPKIVTRFAPSPTGHLHIGGARTAIFCWLLARHCGGEFHLRIEDTDIERSKQEYTDSILASMRWLGLNWDGDLIYQTTRTDAYNAAVDKLLQSGQAYWCSCTPEAVEAMREEARAKGAKPRYNGCCRNKNVGPGQGHCVRLKTPLTGKVVFDDLVKGVIAVDMAELDDMIIRRSDGMPTYNMAVVVDDHDMQVTHVLRGDDHVSNTPRQIVIYEALGLPLPRFGHVPMILGPDRQKLSKRHGARAVIEYEQDGLLPEALVNYLVRLGWSHGDQEIFSLQELVSLFDGTSLNAAASAFDPDKLQWLNAHYLRALDNAALGARTLPFVRALGFGQVSESRVAELAPLFRERASNLADLAQSVKPLLVPAHEVDYDEAAVKKALTAESKAILAALAEHLQENWAEGAAALDAALNTFVQVQGLKFKQVGPPLRVALLGYMGGPHLPEVMAVLGREETLLRLQRGVKLVDLAAQCLN